MDVIKIEGLEKNHGKFHLGPFDLRVETGAILGIQGLEGSGRTTLLRLLWGFERPDKGSVEIFGMKPHIDQMRIRVRAGYAGDYAWFYPGLTTEQFLEFIGGFYPEWDSKYANSLLGQFEINKLNLIRELSLQAQKQLTVIAALGHHPELVFLDEPTADLDGKKRKDMLRFLHKLSRENKVTVVMSTGNDDDLDEFADGVLLLSHGTVRESTR